MLLIPILSLVVVLFTTLTDCYSKFIRPPEYNEDQDADKDMRRNSPYVEGAKISILFDTNIRNTELRICQVIDHDEWKSVCRSLTTDDESESNELEAEYDIAKTATNDEDTVYWFGLWDGEDGPRLARSQYVNVSAPESQESSSVMISETSTLATQLSTTQEPTSTTTEPISTTVSPELNEETSSPSNSGLSRGERAGAIAGGVIGALLILGFAGWLLWTRFVKNKANKNSPAELPDQSQSQECSEARVELPVDDVTNARDYAKSPTGLYEAP